MNKKIVHFKAHPQRGDPAQYPEFDLVMSARIPYDRLCEKVGEKLGVEPTHLRLYTLNTATGLPRTAVKRAPHQTLSNILAPVTYGGLNPNVRPDGLYYEVLDISLAELDTKKSIKVILLSEGITKEVSDGRYQGSNVRH